MKYLDQAKKAAGAYAADFVRPGMNIGIGSGSTVYWLIRELERRINRGLEITGIPTSSETERLAKEAGIRLSDLDEVDRLQLTIDGADEIDPKGQLIKGGGGALLQEKIVAAASDELIIIADSTKLVNQLGRFPLPVEVVSFGYKKVQEKIISSGLCRTVRLRREKSQPFITQHSHYILDCTFGKIDDPFALNSVLHMIPGVVETGLFVNMTSKAIVGFEDGKVEVIHYRS